jgi:predicted double-glycine peptidase
MAAGRHTARSARLPIRRLDRALHFALQAGLALGCLAALVTPAASFDDERGPVRSLREIRREGVIVQKWDVSCGAAALATVLTYSLRDPVSEREVATGMLRMTEPLKVKHRGGFSLLDMKRYVAQRGLKGAGFREMNLDQLRELQSPIVPIKQYGYPHFVIVRGVNEKGRVDIADPAFGNRTMSVATFEDVWQGGIGFTVTK